MSAAGSVRGTATRPGGCGGRRRGPHNMCRVIFRRGTALVLTALALLSIGCGKEREAPSPDSPPKGTEVQTATKRLKTLSSQQLQATQRASRSNDLNTLTQAVAAQQNAQQQAQKTIAVLRQAERRTTLDEYYAARARYSLRMTVILRKAAEARRVEAARLQQKALEPRYATQPQLRKVLQQRATVQRQERQRLDQLYKQQRAEARRQAEQIKD